MGFARYSTRWQALRLWRVACRLCRFVIVPPVFMTNIPILSRLLGATLLLTACAGLPPAVPGAAEFERKAPEAASGYSAKSGWIARKFMATSANPLASEAGYRMLKAGGSAVDAAIAMQLVLTLVEPQSSGIGGGAFLLHFDGARVDAYDGRETAPSAADDGLFQDADGKPLPFREIVIGGRSVGVPGILRMLEGAHRRHGRLPWATLFAPAIELAQGGFHVSPRLAALLRVETRLADDPVAAAYFYDRERKPWPAGHLLKNPELAATLETVASRGADAFYRGPIAADIAAKVNRHPGNPGRLSRDDIAAYEARRRDPVCSDYREWTVCGMPPPSSGGIAIAQMLGILAHRDLRALAPKNGELLPEAVHLFAEAGRLAYADRARYIADPDFVPLPDSGVAALVGKSYLAERSKRIGERSMVRAEAGAPFAASPQAGIDATLELASTSHLAVVDADGNAVSMTASIEDAFGSRQMVRGFLLNNQLTDFSFASADASGPVANRVQPGKRPRSSMAPTFVFEKSSGKLMLATGSPGGTAIINYVAKALVATLDWGLPIQQAIDLPNFGSRNGPTELEEGRISPAMVNALHEKGHPIRMMEQTSGLQGIMRATLDGQDVWLGGADPRREGNAMGD